LVPAKGFGHAIGGELGFRDLVGAATPFAGLGDDRQAAPPARHFPTEPVAAA